MLPPLRPFIACLPRAGLAGLALDKLKNHVGMIAEIKRDHKDALRHQVFIN
jgi:hypothetical protein